jgi:uncharacterized protein with GYD domain
VSKFLLKASYTQKGVQGVIEKGGSARRDAVAQAVAGVGGSLEAFYFALGDDDAVVVVDLPDAGAATALSLAVNAAGGATVKTIQLLTPEEVDQAAKQSVDYRPPGS